MWKCENGYFALALRTRSPHFLPAMGSTLNICPAFIPLNKSNPKFMDFAKFFSDYWPVIVGLILLFGSFFTINQGYIGVVTMFGKYRRIVRPGLNLKIPILETVYRKVSIQNRSVELEFQAVTADQANVY